MNSTVNNKRLKGHSNSIQNNMCWDDYDNNKITAIINIDIIEAPNA